MARTGGNALLVQLPLSGATSAEFVVSMTVAEEKYFLEAQCAYCSNGECPGALTRLEEEAALNMTTFRYGTHLQYGCGKGMAFTGMGTISSTIDTECQWDGNWTLTTLPSCECMFLH